MKDFWHHKKRCTDFKKWQRGKKKAVSLTLHFINTRIKIEHICFLITTHSVIEGVKKYLLIFDSYFAQSNEISAPFFMLQNGIIHR